MHTCQYSSSCGHTRSSYHHSSTAEDNFAGNIPFTVTKHDDFEKLHSRFISPRHEVSPEAEDIYKTTIVIGQSIFCTSS
jgi:hypothetical protein